MIFLKNKFPLLYIFQLLRDVWSDETLQEIINCAFIFWQQSFKHSEGVTYCNRYQVLFADEMLVLPYYLVVVSLIGLCIRSSITLTLL